MVDIAQGDRGEIELVGRDGRGFGFVPVSVIYGPNSVTTSFFVADRAYRIKTIICRPEVAGIDPGAVSAVIRKVPAGTAAGSGTAVQSGSFNLKGTAAANQSAALSATDSDLNLAQNEALAVTFTGTLTAAVGAITVNLCPR